MMHNSGQTCTAPSRMLALASRLAAVEAIACAACEQVVLGDPLNDKTTLALYPAPMHIKRSRP